MDETCAKDGSQEQKPALPICQVCGDGLQGRAVVQCTKCRTLHHLECWRFNKGCSLYGCGCRSSMKPPNDVESTPGGSFEFESSVELTGGWRVGLVLAVSLLLPFVATAANVSYERGMAITVASFLVFFLTLAIAHLRYGRCRNRFTVNGERGMISRTLQLFGRSLQREPNWLAAKDVVEFHLDRSWARVGKAAGVGLRLFVLSADGGRKFVCGEPKLLSIEKAQEFVGLTHRLAAFADCTVREFEWPKGPSDAEIAEAVGQHRLLQEPLGSERAAGPAHAAPETRADAREDRPPPVRTGGG